MKLAMIAMGVCWLAFCLYWKPAVAQSASDSERGLSDRITRVEMAVDGAKEDIAELKQNKLSDRLGRLEARFDSVAETLSWMLKLLLTLLVGGAGKTVVDARSLRRLHRRTEELASKAACPLAAEGGCQKA